MAFYSGEGISEGGECIIKEVFMLKKLIADFFFRVLNSQHYKQIDIQEKLHYTNFKSFGLQSKLPDFFLVKNPQYITIGNNFSSLHNLRIEAWDEYDGEKYSPEIIIGNNVSLNSDVHIGCINKVVIGDNVLMASRIYISDHSHGEISTEALTSPPLFRKLVSKGPVIIEDCVWIGEGVVILPGVTIGKNCIVGANAVVTRSFPANSVIAGIPARIIKTLD